MHLSKNILEKNKKMKKLKKMIHLKHFGKIMSLIA